MSEAGEGALLQAGLKASSRDDRFADTTGAGAMLVAHPPLLLRRGALRRLGAPPRGERQGQSTGWPPSRHIICLRLTCQLSSGTADDVVQAVIDRVHAAGPSACTVVLDLRHTRAIGDDARGALQALQDMLAQGQSRLRLAHPAAEARATLTVDGPLGAIRPADVHGSLREALLAAHASLPGPALVTSAIRRLLTEPPELLSLP